MNNDVLDAAHAIWSQRYSGADVVLAAGSIVRGEATAYSDLDLVVVYSKLPCAYRESFSFHGLPVEAFVHDPETLESNVPGLYLAGAILTGKETGRIFIENSRHHARQIARSIAERVSSVHA